MSRQPPKHSNAVGWKAVADAWGTKCDLIMRALDAMDATALKSHTDFMMGRRSDFVVSNFEGLNTEADRSQWGNGVKVVAQPLCVLLERIKLTRYSADNAAASAAVEVLVTDWKADPNMVFNVKEKRPAAEPRPHNPGDVVLRMQGRLPPDIFYRYNITSTPLSWLLYLRFGDARDEIRVRACMEQLLKLGADPNVPFRLVIEPQQAEDFPVARYDFWKKSRQHDAAANALNGRSLLHAAMESQWGIDCIEMLLDYGARFGENDPHPFRVAIWTYGAELAVPLFLKYWRQGKLTQRDVLSVDTDEDCEGMTAMHDIARFPPYDAAARTCLKMMIEMGFAPRTSSWSALQYTEDGMQLATDARKDMIELMRGVIAEADERVMVMARYKAALGVGGGLLPKDAAERIHESLHDSRSMAQIAKVEERVRKLRLSAAQSARLT